jgi:hypothetical protein
VSIPFMFYLHGQPHDCCRFTRFGIDYLAQSAGFEVLESVASGGLCHFLCNFPSVLMSSLRAWLRLPTLIWPTTQFWLWLARQLDHQLDQDRLFAMSHILVLCKSVSIEA